MDLTSAHSQESDFQESGEVDRFSKMGTHFQERSGSLENGLCVTWSGFWLCPGYLWLLILAAVEQIYDQITRRLVAQRVAPAARAILSQTPSFRRWRLVMETMAYWQQVSLSLHNAVICLYSRDLARWYQQDPHSSKNLSSRKCTPYHTKARRWKRLNYGSRLNVGLPPTKLLLRLTEQLLHVQQMVFVEATFPSNKAFGAVQVLTPYTNCSTEVGKILFFLFFVEESSERAAKTIACPSRKHVGGYTAGVCLNTNTCLTHDPQRVARSRTVLSLFLQPIISYRVRLHDDFV